MSFAEPPGRRAETYENRFYIIPDERGFYTVRDELHLRGGHFIDRAQARHYALSENGNRPDLIVELPASPVSFFKEVAVSCEFARASRNQIGRKAA